MTTLAEIQDLYDRNLFLQAYKKSSDYWRPSIHVANLSMAEMILGGRLALRLGGPRLSRWLFMAAYERDPADPRARYYSTEIRRRDSYPFADLRAFELQPDLGGDDPELRGAWFALNALRHAQLRDFALAETCLSRAHSLAPRNSWILSCESGMLGLAYRGEEALKAAELAWELCPGAPFVAPMLGSSLLQLGRIEEAALRLATAAEAGESCELAVMACWHLCALAETIDGAKRSQALGRARALAEALPNLAPLADREAHAGFAHMMMDIAVQQGDRDAIRVWAEKTRLPLSLRFVEKLQNRSASRRICLPFRRVLQGRDTCLPASICAVLAGLGIEVDVEAIASDITFGGTSIWAAAEWLQKLGIVSRFFIIQPEIAAHLMRNGIPFILSQNSTRGVHAVAVIGLDEGTETLLIHDPNSFRTNEYLLETIGDDEAPLGPQGLAIVPQDKAQLLDRLLPPEHTEAATAFWAYLHLCEKNGPKAARRIVDELSKKQPAHPTAQYLQAIQLRHEGRTGEALIEFQQLLNRYPNCYHIRHQLLITCRSLANTALIRNVLKDLVERGVLPGTQPAQDWRGYPLAYACQYAEQLCLSHATRPKARLLLKSVLRRNPACADAWHTLGDLLRSDRDSDGMLLCFRIASCIEGHNENHAIAYCQALRSAGREEEGLAWLEARVRKFSSSPRASGPWISWISSLEYFGHPERALAACEEAFQAGRASAELLAFAVPLLLRMGQQERAENGMKHLEAAGNPPLCFEAALFCHRMHGDLAAAVQCAEAWAHESPLSMPARAQWLDLVARRDGKRAAADLAALWTSEHPGHDQFEALYYHQLEYDGSGRKQDILLLRRVKRNPEDGWAWRMLALRRMLDYQRASDQRRKKLLPRIEKLLSQCDRTAQGDPATLCAKAFWHEVRGRWSEAVSAWLAAIEPDPIDSVACRRAWECCAGLQEGERRKVFEHIEATLLASIGHLAIARDMIFLIAQRYGAAVAEEAAMRWQSRRPDDPEVLAAGAALLLEYGRGRSDASRSLAMLEPAVRRYPYHLGLRLSLANAYIALGKFTEAEEILQDILPRLTEKSIPYLQSASMREQRGDTDQAAEILETALASDPLNPQIWAAQAGFLMRTGRTTEAHTTILDRLQRLPQNAEWRDIAIQMLLENGHKEDAEAAAREGVRILAGQARSWYCLAETLMRVRVSAETGEIEGCLRKAISCDGCFYDAVDALSLILADQHVFEEAAAAIEHILPRLADPAPARGRLAWIRREQGRPEEALEQMTAAVRAAPWFRWGWQQLMDWLLADKKWDIARELLCPHPPLHRTDERFRRQRLQILTAAGTPVAELDAEWNELLAEFPENTELHLERYDELRRQSRFAESAAVLEVIRRFHANHPQVLARQVEVKAAQGRSQEALDALMRVWFELGDESHEAADYAWASACTARINAEAYAKARRLVEQGRRPTLPAFAIMTARAKYREGVREQSRRSLWRSLFPGAGARELMALLEMVDRAPWADGHFRATLFSRLTALGYHRLVIRYWQQSPSRTEAHVHSWGWLGVALHGADRKKEARRLLASWREHPGVAMWVVANYVRCFDKPNKEECKEILSACRDALVGLPHDSCARYLAHVQAEMCAHLDDLEAFRETWTRYRHYFSGELSENDWFESERAHLLDDIPRLGRFVDKNRMEDLRGLCRQLRAGLPRGTGGAYAPKPINDIPWWVWFLLVLTLLRIMSWLTQK